jgi:large subunit ribosomal protein L14
MIYKCTKFVVIDNTGAEEANFFALPGLNSLNAKIGDKIKVSITKAKPNRPIKKGSVHHAVICSLKKAYNNKGKMRASCSINSVVLVNEKGMIGTRVLAPIIGSPDLRKKFPEISSRGEVY